jgi:4,5-DOPA dioxygenase extradiol
MSQLMPTLFISHGSPMLALDEEPTSLFLRTLSDRLPKPDAIIVASAHWETSNPFVSGAPTPETIYDFYGFPRELYEITYPAAGNPALAAHVQTLLAEAGFDAAVDPERGLDHGAWDPLYLMYPQANIPTIELSVQPCRDARWHYNLGQALATLRKDNVLIIGSGNLTHNLRDAFRGTYTITPEWVIAFREWVARNLESHDIDALLDWQKQAPQPHLNHPTTEHFIPLFVAMGAGGEYTQLDRLNVEVQMSVLSMDAYLFS